METNDINPDNPRKEYTGVWIPREVMECEELTPIEKIAYGEIASFNECYASNAWLAKRLGKSAKTASQSITKLKKLGFIEDAGFNGRFRKIKAIATPIRGELPGRLAKNFQADWRKISTIDKSIDKSINTAPQPKAASQTSRKKSEFNVLIENLCSLLSIDVSKINWAAARRWYNEGRNSNCSDEDFIKAAKAMKKVCDEGRIAPSLYKVFTNTSYWLSVSAPEKPKGVW